MGATIRLGFRPRRRLRHLKEIRLVGLFGGREGEEQEVGELFFEIHCRMPGEEQELVLAYRSEKVPSERNMAWSPIELDLSSLAPSILHGRHSGILAIKVFRTTIGDCLPNEDNTSSSETHYEKVMDVEVDLNTLVPWTFDRGIQFQLVDGCYGASSMPDVSSSLESSSNEADISDLERILSGSAASISGEDEMEDVHSSVLYCKSCKHAPSVNLNDLTQQLQVRGGPGSMHSSSSAPNLVPEDDAINNSLDMSLQSDSKVYSLGERRADIRRLLTAHRSLCELVDRHRTLHRYITDALAREEELHQKRMHLKQLKESFARHRARFTSAKAKLVVLKSQWKHNQERNLLRAGTLEDAAGALQGACQRWKDAEEVLAGPKGVGKLRDLQLELVTRRSRLVTSLSQLYELGPRTAADPMFRANQLEESFNQRWYMGKEGMVPNGKEHSFRLYQYSEGFLSIMGLELTPSLVELVKNGVIGWSSDPELCQRAAAVLGYVAHFTNLCSKYLDVPLRYPIKPRGSMSVIYNWAASTDRSHTNTIQVPWIAVQSKRLLPGPSEEPPSLPPPMAFSLYYQGTTRSKFAFAVFLLGKDVQQLLSAHGIKPSGSKYVLQNLHNLVAAAYSGLVHQKPQP